MVFDAVQGVSSNSDLINQPEMQAALQEARQATTAQAREKVKEEFLAIFYKEILKKVFKAPNMSIGKEEERDTTSLMLSNFSADLMVEKMAMDLAKQQILNFNPEGAAEIK